MFQPDVTGVYARVSASNARRYFAFGVLYSLGGLLIYVAIARPVSLMGALALLALGCVVLILGERLRGATSREIMLTDTELRDSTGMVLARVDDIVAVERSAFAMKPSNGFTLVLREKAPRAWVPGMWWRIGRRVGVGGTTNAGPAKFMAEQIAFRIAQR
ncbi:hypothetical protein [Yoonia sp. MH D7]